MVTLPWRLVVLMLLPTPSGVLAACDRLASAASEAATPATSAVPIAK